MYPTIRPPRHTSQDPVYVPGRRSARSPLTLIFLAASVVLWGIGLATTNATALGPYGLITALSPFFILGVALLVVSAGIEFAQSQLSELRLGLHATALVAMLYGTAPLLYSEGRYAWLYKTIGVVQYVDQHGSLDRSIDIYQSWPGFFAFAAWFDKVAGVSSPLDYAKWTQLVFELAAIPLLHAVYSALSLRPWHRWLAIMLYAASNWIGQDYFSPQGVSTLLSFGIMAIAARWLFVLAPRRNGPIRFGWARTRRLLPFIAVLLFLFFVLTATHELSPYILTIQIAAVAVCGLARPRWVGLAVAVVTVGYLAPNFTYVNTHYGLTASVGSFFSNVHPPSSSAVYPAIPLPKSTRILNYCADVLVLGMWLLALVGAWRNRKARRIVFALLILTFSPILVLVGGAYGNEGVLRVYLFSLPWAAALASCALAPVRPKDPSARRSPLRVIIPLGLAVAFFVPAFYGYDAANTMTSDEVNTLVSFQNTAKPGLILTALENLPVSDTAKYNEFSVGEIFGSDGVASGIVPSGDVAAYVARSVKDDLGNEPTYVVVTPSMVAYNQIYGLTYSTSFAILESSLSKSPYWHLLLSHDGIVIYSLTAAVDKIPAGPHADAVIAAVP